MRLHLRAPGERVKPEEALYRLHPAEVPVKNAVRASSQHGNDSASLTAMHNVLSCSHVVTCYAV